MWARVASAAVGIGLMAAPGIFEYAGAAADNHRIVGPAVAGLSMVAISGVMRPVRWAALPLALWLVAAALIIEQTVAASVVGATSGVVLAALAPVRGMVRQSFGGGWSSLLPREGRKGPEPGGRGAQRARSGRA